jgi:carboxylesterase
MSTRESGEPEPARPGCLILHGLGGGLYELGRLPDVIREAGFLVDAPILPGHRVTGPKMPDSRWQDWFETARHAHDALASSTSGPVLVLGFSTGGTLALRLALETRLAGLILLAPFLAIRYSRLVPVRPLSYLRHLSRMVPWLPRRSPPIRDKAMKRWASAQDRFTTFNLRATVSALELIEIVRPRVGEITVPTLIQQGTRDSVVEPSHAAWLHAHLGADEGSKTLRWYIRSDHLLALDRQRAEVEADLLAHLSGMIRPLDRGPDPL